MRFRIVGRARWIVGVVTVVTAVAGCARAESAQQQDEAAKQAEWSEWGRVDVEEVESSLQTYAGLDTHCLEEATQAGKERWGHVVVSFVISENGELARVDFSENTAGETAARCIEKMLRKVQFPEPTGGPVLLRKFVAYSPDGEFDTERDASAFVSDDDGAIVLTPSWTVPITTKSAGDGKTKSTGSDDGSSNRKPRVDLSVPVEMSGPGELSSMAVDSILRLYAGAIRGCYVNFLKTHDDKQGKVTVTFKLHEDGSMSELRATNNSVGGQMGKCVAEEVQGGSFSSPEGGYVVVTKTFGFELE